MTSSVLGLVFLFSTTVFTTVGSSAAPISGAGTTHYNATRKQVMSFNTSTDVAIGPKETVKRTISANLYDIGSFEVGGSTYRILSLFVDLRIAAPGMVERHALLQRYLQKGDTLTELTEHRAGDIDLKRNQKDVGVEITNQIRKKLGVKTFTSSGATIVTLINPPDTIDFSPMALQFRTVVEAKGKSLTAKKVGANTFEFETEKPTYFIRTIDGYHFAYSFSQPLEFNVGAAAFTCYSSDGTADSDRHVIATANSKALVEDKRVDGIGMTYAMKEPKESGVVYVKDSAERYYRCKTR